MKRLDYIEEIHGHTPDSAIIWLHGLGADGYDFKPIVKQLALPPELSIHFIFPHAPVQSVTLNHGMNMNAWYDIHALSLEAKEDQAGIQSSMHAVEALISHKFAHLDSTRIIIAGFSQGGALALHTMLHGSQPIGGIVALSAYLPVRHLLAKANQQRVIGHKVFMAHGEYDEIIPLQFGKLANDALVALGADVCWRTYPMAHEVCTAQIRHIREWLIAYLG